MSRTSFLFTSESVSEGHPDKVAARISDTVVDLFLSKAPYARVACETLVKTGVAIVAGEVTTSAWVDIEELTRKVINDIGYDNSSVGFDGHTCAIINMLGKQSPDIAAGVDGSKKKQKKPENFQQHSSQYKKAAKENENNAFQQMDIDSLVNAIEQDSLKQAGRKKAKKKAQKVNPEQSAMEQAEPNHNVSTGDPEDSEEFENVLCSFQVRLQQASKKAKIKPNVSKHWLEGLKKQLQSS